MGDESLDFRVDKEYAKKNPWASFVPEFAKDSTGQEFVRCKGRSVAYKIVTENEKGEQTYKCASCGGEILTATVAHPIWDGPFPGSGAGECKYEGVLYCPKCEKKPESNGLPIQKYHL